MTELIGTFYIETFRVPRSEFRVVMPAARLSRGYRGAACRLLPLWIFPWHASANS